jgi:small Trp-rich protein
MLFVLIGLALCGLKAAEIGPFAAWSWWAVLSPFALAAVWWFIADSTGLTKKRAIDRMDDRKAARRKRDMEALGLDTRKRGAAPSRAAPARSGASGGSGRDPVSAAVDAVNAQRRDPTP